MGQRETTDVIIVGAGGHGCVVLDILRSQGRYNVVGFIDADAALADTTVAGVRVIGQLNVLPKLLKEKVRHAIVGIGDNRSRVLVAQKLLAAGFELINAVHPSATVSSAARVGRNVVIAAGAIVSTAAVIHDSVILNTGSIVDHECDIGEGAHICPGAALAGRVSIGAGVFVGLGASIIQCLSIGSQAVVGAGSVVLQDVTPGATVVGVPARVVKTADPAGQA